jgi:hypothetical protein
MTLNEWLASDVTGAKTAASLLAAFGVVLYVLLLLFGSRTDDDGNTTVAHSKAAERKDLRAFGVIDETPADLKNSGRK